MSSTLYERLGGASGVEAIANEVVDRHFANPIIKTRFIGHEIAELKVLSRDFFSAGTGGPNHYAGRDMRTAHVGLNLNERELVAVIDDVLVTLDAHEIDAGTRAEILAILYSFKDEILFQ
jgi:hemoglobin